MAEELERIYTIPLKKYNHKKTKSAPTAVKRVKKYLTKHMKVEENKIWIDDSLNNSLWKHGKYNMPSKIRVKAVKFDDGVVEAYLPELDFKKSRREILKEEKEKKAPILRREEEELEGEETGTEDYEIAPAADGDVKIKKKKPTEKEEKDESEEKEKNSEKKESKEKTKQKPSKKTEKKSDDKKKQSKSKKKDTKKKSTKSKSSSKSKNKPGDKKNSKSK